MYNTDQKTRAKTGLIYCLAKKAKKYEILVWKRGQSVLSPLERPQAHIVLLGTIYTNILVYNVLREKHYQV